MFSQQKNDPKFLFRELERIYADKKKLEKRNLILERDVAQMLYTLVWWERDDPLSRELKEGHEAMEGFHSKCLIEFYNSNGFRTFDRLHVSAERIIEGKCSLDADFRRLFNDVAEQMKQIGHLEKPMRLIYDEYTEEFINERFAFLCCLQQVPISTEITSINIYTIPQVLDIANIARW